MGAPSNPAAPMHPLWSRAAQRRGITLDDNNAFRYYQHAMIRSFRDRDAETLFRGRRPRRLPEVVLRAALRRLEMLHAAVDLADLRVAPGSRLEKLGGDREGQHGIRINDQWRICFVWWEGDAYDVEITDYH